MTIVSEDSPSLAGGSDDPPGHEVLQGVIRDVLSDVEQSYPSAARFRSDFDGAMDHLKSHLTWASEEDPDYDHPLVAEAYLLAYMLRNTAALNMVLRSLSPTWPRRSVVRLLDIGTGTGATISAAATALARRPLVAVDVAAVEPSDRMFTVAERVTSRLSGRRIQLGLARHPMRRLEDAPRYSQGRGLFDAIVCWFALDKPSAGDDAAQASALLRLATTLDPTRGILLLGSPAEREKAVHLNALAEALLRRGLHLAGPDVKPRLGGDRTRRWSWFSTDRLARPSILEEWAEERGIQKEIALDVKFNYFILTRHPGRQFPLPEELSVEIH